MNYEQLQLKEYLSILGIALGGNKICVYSCLFVVNFSLCRSLSAVALAKADVFVAKKIRVNPCLSVVNSSSCLGNFVAETQLVRRSLGEGGSIKND